MKTLLIATTNPGKLEEFADLLKELPARLVSPGDLGIDLNIEETGSTYADNAALKARAYCRASMLPTLADDSGLEVHALGGAPGLYSARYASAPGATDADRRAILLENLKAHPRPWNAVFRAVVAVAAPPPEPDHAIKIETVEGMCHGEIIPREKGSNGFGYDPIFYFTELNRTMAELGMDEKNRISHRGRAVQAALPLLRNML